MTVGILSCHGVILLVVSPWTVMLISDLFFEAAWVMLSLCDQLSSPVHHNERVLGDPMVSTRESSLKSCMPPGNFTYFSLNIQEKKSSSFIEKTLSYYNTYWIQIYVLTQLRER